MSTEPKEAAKSDDNRQSWLRNFLLRSRQGKTVDVIGADIGEDARNIVVGKNILQIGTIIIPIWILLVVMVAVLLTVSIAIFNAVTTGQIRSVVLAPPTVTSTSIPTSTPTSTPTATPTSTPTPLVMPDGNFNIAVADFQVISSIGEIVHSDEFRGVASNVANYLVNQEDDLGSVIHQQVVVWGPKNGLGAVTQGTEAEQAKALNADVLLYGELHQLDDGNWKLIPRFFLTDEVVHRASELYGEHSLGTHISYRPDNTASTRDLNTALEIRLEALIQILLGLSYYSFGTMNGYVEAASIFDATTNTEWGRANDGSGQEVLYLFQGNVFLKWATFSEDNQAERTDLLRKSRNAYMQAIERNRDYGRAYNGLGSALFQSARPVSSEDDECNWDWAQIEQAETNYRRALDVSPTGKPASGQVDLRGYLGLGRIRFWQGYCGESFPPAEWIEAQNFYEAALVEYEAASNPIFDLEAALIYSDLGFMDLQQADQALFEHKDPDQVNTLLSDAMNSYRLALELAIGSGGKEEGEIQAISIMPYYLTAICLRNDGDEAKAILEEFVASVSGSIQVREEILANTPIWEECNP